MESQFAESAKKDKKMENRCVVCNKKFDSNKYWKKYCSYLCTQAMWALRRFTLENLKKETKRREKDEPKDNGTRIS